MAAEAAEPQGQAVAAAEEPQRRGEVAEAAEPQGRAAEAGQECPRQARRFPQPERLRCLHDVSAEVEAAVRVRL